MRLTAHLLLETDSANPVPCIVMLHPKSSSEQAIELDELETSIPCPSTGFIDVYGNLCLRMVIPPGPFTLKSRIKASCTDTVDVELQAGFVPMEAIPDNILQFVLPSRYCEADRLGYKARQISQYATHGYAQVESIRGWVHDHFIYAYGTTDSSTSAIDVLALGTGVCRDYAHAGIALCRSLNIPARMAVGYLYGLEPMDLHAWFEAYIGERWYTFDATQDTPRGNRIVVAYGRDAADVAMATYFGNMTLIRLQVGVEAIEG